MVLFYMGGGVALRSTDEKFATLLKAHFQLYPPSKKKKKRQKHMDLIEFG